mgnify:CR=1 FL=1
MKNILFVASEGVPFIKTGGLADVVGSLPKCIDKKYFDVRVILPRYTCMKQEMKDKLTYKTHFYMDFHWKEEYVGILEAEVDGVRYYFIDNEGYFNGFKPYGDNALFEIEKYAFFCKAALSILPVIDFRPDVIHCHDWQTGLIPGMEKADDYLLQAIVETVVLVIFLGITYIFGLWDIFKENAAGWTRSLYTGGFFIVYCLYAVVSGIYLCFLGEHGDVKAFYNIIFFFIAVCLVGLVEELVFRGVVFNLLLRAFPKTKGGITGAVVLGGVLFGLMHFSNMGAGVKFSSCLIQVISAGLMGVLFCMIYASTRNFWMLAIFHTVVDMGGLLSSGIFEGGGVADRINEFSAMNCIAFVVLGIPMLVMLRKSRRIRLEMLYNNVTIIDDEREGAKLAVVSLVLGICSIIFSFFGYLMGLGIVGMLASKMSKRAKQYNNAIATAGMITSIIGFVLSVICTIGMMVLFASGMYDRLVNMSMLQ